MSITRSGVNSCREPSIGDENVTPWSVTFLSSGRLKT